MAFVDKKGINDFFECKVHLVVPVARKISFIDIGMLIWARITEGIS